MTSEKTDAPWRYSTAMKAQVMAKMAMAHGINANVLHCWQQLDSAGRTAPTKIFGETRPHHAYLFANRRANGMKEQRRQMLHFGAGAKAGAFRVG
jgi:hypothetical protein